MMLALIVSTSSLFSQNEAAYLNDVQERLKYIEVENVRKAFNDFSSKAGYDKATYSAKLAELEAACKKGTKGIEAGDAAAVANAELILKLASEILMSNPALDFDKILLSKYKMVDGKDRKDMAASLGTQPSNWTNQMSSRRNGFDAEIVEISNLRGEMTTRQVYKPENTSSIADLQLHWNADRILFSAVNEKGMWSVYEANMDGSNVHEVIKVEEDDLEFTDGSFLPDGRYMAVSNVGYHGVPCVSGSAPVGNMMIYDPKTDNLRRTTFDQDANWHPTVMNNGRLMYVRWEYTDLTHYYSRIVMHANPDGTEAKALYGSGCFFPNSIFDVKPIPGGGTSFISIVSGHHGVVRSGRLMIFDPAKGRTSIDGLVQELPFSDREVEPVKVDRLVDGVWPQFIKPYPIDDTYFLVAAKLTPTSLWGIYLIDIYDNMTLLLEQEGYGFISPIVVEKREIPPVIPDKVDLSKKEATVFIQDIYEGEGLPGVPRGTIKKLRIFAYEYAYNKTPSNHTAHGIQSGWDIKRILGEVDVEDDGSVVFKVPANTPFSMQPIDSEGRAVQWMRSWTTGMPGETISCVGCHEDQNALVMPKRTSASLNTNPEMVSPLPGGVRPVTFDFDVQPILNRACIACHDGENGWLDLTSRLDVDGIDPSKLSGQELEQYKFDEPMKYTKAYLSIHPYVERQGPEADALVMKPYEYHASTSELVRLLKRGHYGVELTDDEWRSLYMWIDLNAPFNGSFNYNPYRGYNQYDRRRELMDKYACGMSVDWEQELKDYAAYLNGEPKVEPVMPEEKSVRYTKVKAPKWPMTTADAKALQADLGETEMSLKIAEGVSIKFRKIPAGSFVMGDNNVGYPMAPASKVKIADAFWIGEVEVTNEQFNVVFPEHDNRYVAQFWKDHVNAGYEANRPTQPVMRITWDEAMAFCEEISKITGKTVTLPSEAQWEWAARAGSDGAFWYGNTNTDFSKYENLADMNLQYMAVLGVDPKPMQQMLKTNKNAVKWLKYYTYIPRVEEVDDKNMLMTDVASYQANPWGLYDMHGNVAEWTRSDYVSYPYDSKAEGKSTVKAIRGGHWTSRPKNATAAYRNGYFQWQPANNVGFRVVIEE